MTLGFLVVKSIMKNFRLSPRLYSVVCVLAFLAYVDAALLSLPDLASVLTGDIVRHFHFSRLPLIDRVVRSEIVYVLVSFCGIWLFSKLRGNAGLNVTFGQFSRLLPETILGFLLILTVWFLAVVIQSHIEQKPIVIANHHFPLLTLVILYLLTAVAEETVFRGYVLQMIEKHWGTGIAICVSSVVFGLDHLLGERLSFFDVLYIIVFGGLPYGAAFAYTRRLWLPIGLHWGDDFGYTLFTSGPGYVQLYHTDVIINARVIFSSAELYLGFILVILAVRSRRWRSFRSTEANLHPVN